MSEWKECKLGEVYDFASGLSKSRDQFGFGYSFLSFRDVFHNYFVPKEITQLANSTEKERERCSIKRGDVFLTRTSETQEELGVSSVALKDYPDATFNGFTKRLRPKNNIEILPEYAGFYFRSPRFRATVTSMASITTRASLNNGMLSELTVVIPPLPEQRAIASVLSSLDDKIDILHRQNTTLEAMAETLFRQWFVGSDYSCKVSDLIEIQNGYAFKSKDFKDVGVNSVIKIKNISGNIVDIYNCDFIEESVANKTDSRFDIEAGNVLFAMIGAEIGKMGIVPQTEQKLWLNQRVGLFKETYNGSRFLAYLQLKSDYGQDYIDNTATGSAQPNISSSGIVNCDFPNISEEQIIIYSNQISSLFAKIVFNLGQIRTLKKLRDALLPKLMSGEVRVKSEQQEVRT